VSGAGDVTGPTNGGPWVEVCPYDWLPPDMGVAALVGAAQVAVFRLADGSVHAIDHRDPKSGANVLARGIVGDAEGVPFVASPVYKERYDLRTGRCLEAGLPPVTSWPVRVRRGMVEVARSPRPLEGVDAGSSVTRR
jgi:nitrite reductase (NADH) small subunit